MRYKIFWRRRAIYWAIYVNSIYVRVFDCVLIAAVVLSFIACTWLVYKSCHLKVLPAIHSNSTIGQLASELESAWWREHSSMKVTRMQFLQHLSITAKHSGLNLKNILFVSSTIKNNLMASEYSLDAYGSWASCLVFLQHLDTLPGVQSWSNGAIEVSSGDQLHLQLQLFNWQGVV